MSAPSFDAPLLLGAQIEARGAHPEVGERVFLRQHDRTWTYRATATSRVRMAHFLRRRLGPIDDAAARPRRDAAREPPRAARALRRLRATPGCTLFGVNTGLRGDTLAGVLNQSRARAAGRRRAAAGPRSSACAAELAARRAREHPRAAHRRATALDAHRPRWRASRARSGRPSDRSTRPAVDVDPTTPLMVIYTSGTTGPAEGHQQQPLQAAARSAWRCRRNLGLGAGRRRLRLHAALPLERDLPRLHARASGSAAASAMRERFSASELRARRAPLRRHLLELRRRAGALRARARSRSEYGGDEARIRAEVTEQPAEPAALRRRQRRRRRPTSSASCDWLGLEDMFELYGSTEAAISTFRKKGDPRGCVGEITDAERARS